ncbi:MAG TPA: hypothetical protein VGZ22_14205 [Isosphaeraceae bacterium]|jgi:hypothetical protein|nr:hypothetical protein [Isosphaeraceae bacterium]
MLDRRLSLGLIALAIAVRVAAVLVLQSHKVPHSTYEHGEIAANLLAGRGFSVKFLGAEGPTSQQAPVYPAVVAATYALGGIGTPTSLLILELGQAVLGGLLVAAVLALAGEVAPRQPRMALAAGFIAAVHPTLVYAATHVQVALLAATLLTVTLAWAYRLGRTGRDRDALISGLLLAVLTLTDPILGLVLPGLGWAIAMRRGVRASIRPLTLLILAALVGVMPWTIRNARVHGEIVWVKSTFGYAFWQGNCALSQGTDKVVRPSIDRALTPKRAPAGLRDFNRALWTARHEAGYLDDIALSQADYKLLSQLSEPARSRWLFHRAISDLRADPMRYPQLCLRRLRYFVLFDETNPKTRSLIYRASHLGLTVLAVIGLVVARPGFHSRLGPTLLTAALITLFHSLTIVSARFHIPLEPLMALWAAGAMSRWERAPSSAPSADDVVGVGVEGRLAIGKRVGLGDLRPVA